MPTKFSETIEKLLDLYIEENNFENMIDTDCVAEFIEHNLKELGYQDIEWCKLSEKLPIPDIGVLVYVEAAGFTYDVAAYRGVDAGGEHRWILADVSLDPRDILAWAYIPSPPWLQE